MSNLHLAIVSPFPPAITGIGQFGYHVTRMLADSGALGRISLLTSKADSPADVPLHRNVTVERIWQMNHADTGMRITSRLLQLNPDVVWFNLGATAFGSQALANVMGLLSPGMTRRLGLSTVVTMHEMPMLADVQLLQAPGGPLRKLGMKWVTWALTQADVVCLTLKYYVDWLTEHCPGGTYVHIPIGLYRPADQLPEPQAPELLFFTTAAPFKGLESLLAAFRILQQRMPHVHLTIAGAEHPRFPGYLKQVQRAYCGLHGVRWLGYVPETEVRNLFAQCQVVVLPYQATTGSSSVLYQAMMWGRPVISSDLPELRSATSDMGLQTLLYPRGDHAELASALERLLCAPDLRRRMVTANHQAIRRLHLDNTCRAYLSAFDIALTMRSRRGHVVVPQDMMTETAA